MTHPLPAAGRRNWQIGGQSRVSTIDRALWILTFDAELGALGFTVSVGRFPHGLRLRPSLSEVPARCGVPISVDMDRNRGGAHGGI